MLLFSMNITTHLQKKVLKHVLGLPNWKTILQSIKYGNIFHQKYIKEEKHLEKIYNKKEPFIKALFYHL